MLAACGTAGNRDLEPHVPALVSCIAKPDEVPQVIAKLSATTFVQVCGWVGGAVGGGWPSAACVVLDAGCKAASPA